MKIIKTIALLLAILTFGNTTAYANMRITGGLPSYTVVLVTSTTPLVDTSYESETEASSYITIQSFESEGSYESETTKTTETTKHTILTPFTISDIIKIISAREIEAQEVTFDIYRTVTGTAAYGTHISLFLLVNTDEEYGLQALAQKHVTVGPSGVFSLEIPLSEGGNILVLTAYNQEDETASIVTSKLRRMPFNIRQQLELFTPRIPGETTN